MIVASLAKTTALHPLRCLLKNSLTPALRSMLMFVRLRFMGRMLVLVTAVFPGMDMVMHVGIRPMGMFMGMLVQMLVGVHVLVLMQVDFVPVPMLMAVHMGMVMGVQMLMFVFALHGGSPF